MISWFGEDVDLVSWDSNSADAHVAWKLEHFAHRVMHMDNVKRPLRKRNAITGLIDFYCSITCTVLSLAESKYILGFPCMCFCSIVSVDVLP